MATSPEDAAPAVHLRRRRTRIAWALFGLIIAGVLAGPWMVLALAFWATDGAWDFEGRGARHWLLVQGSRLDRMGLVEVSSTPVSYSVSLQEGTFPGWRIAIYASRASPADVVAAYTERCKAMRFKVTAQQIGPQRAELTCEIEPYIDVELAAERASEAAHTRVSLKVWGSP